MKVLVFGATGQVAMALQQHEGVTALGRAAADLTDPAACADIIGSCDADAVINAAAYTAVDQAESDQETAFAVNAVAPARMAKAAAQRDIPFLTISTDYVFDGAGTKPHGPADRMAPLNVYGRSKAEGEDGVRAAGGRHVVLRTSWVFSEHGKNFVKTMLQLAATRDHLTIVDDQIGGPTAAHDIADTLMHMARQMVGEKTNGGTYHLSGTPDASWADFAREIFRQAGHDVRVSPIATADYPTPAQRPLNSRLDCQSLFDDFGISQPDWRASLSRVLTALGKG